MMKNEILKEYIIDYVEIYTAMAKPLAYWHTHALGFRTIAWSDNNYWTPGLLSYVLNSGDIRIVLTSAYPTMEKGSANNDVSSYVASNYCGIKKIALRVPSVTEAFEKAIADGAFPLKFPVRSEDGQGFIEEASIKFYDNSEIVFVNRDFYRGVFKPGYLPGKSSKASINPRLLSIDHIAGEVRINESRFWSDYLNKAIGTSLVQSIDRGENNRTGMILNINQSFDKHLTLVIAEPESYKKQSKMQRNVDNFGPGIHHLALSTDSIADTIKEFSDRDVEFVSFPNTYYDLLRSNDEFKEIDIDKLQLNNILIDREEDGYLMQTFVKPISDRPYFIYEIVQRINGYHGFALKNINVLKKAEELEIMK